MIISVSEKCAWPNIPPDEYFCELFVRIGPLLGFTQCILEMNIFKFKFFFR